MAEESIKLAFVERSLDNYLKKVSGEMVGAIDKLDAKDTEELRKSVAGKTVKGSGQSDGQAQLFFNEYGRMVDMGAGRKVKRTGKMSAKQKREANKLRKPKKFYSPIAYGNLNPLINELQYGLTEEVIADIKKQFSHVS